MAATAVSRFLQPRASRRAIGSFVGLNPPIATALQWGRCRYANTNPFIHLEAGRSWTFGARGRNSRGGMVIGNYADFMEEDDDEDEEEEEDRSLDLLIRFIENVFRNVSKKARKAVKSVLPVPISAKLVGFAVNGTIILTFLWVLKAFLDVVCTLGSVVFSAILLIRGIWTAISYFHQVRSFRADDDDPQSWNRARPAF